MARRSRFVLEDREMVLSSVAGDSACDRAECEKSQNPEESPSSDSHSSLSNRAFRRVVFGGRRRIRRGRVRE